MKGTNKTPANRYLAQMHYALEKAEAATTPFQRRIYEQRAADFARKFSDLFRDKSSK